MKKNTNNHIHEVICWLTIAAVALSSFLIIVITVFAQDNLGLTPNDIGNIKPRPDLSSISNDNLTPPTTVNNSSLDTPKIIQKNNLQLQKLIINYSKTLFYYTAFNNLTEQGPSSATVAKVAKGLSQIDSTVKDMDNQIKNLSKANIETASLDQLLNKIKSQVTDVKKIASFYPINLTTFLPALKNLDNNTQSFYLIALALDNLTGQQKNITNLEPAHTVTNLLNNIR